MDHSSDDFARPENEETNAFTILLKLINLSLRTGNEEPPEHTSSSSSSSTKDPVSDSVDHIIDEDNANSAELVRAVAIHLLGKLALVERSLEKTKTTSAQLIESREFFRLKYRNLRRSYETLRVKYDSLEGKYQKMRQINMRICSSNQRGSGSCSRDQF